MIQDMHITIKQTRDSQQPFVLLHDMANEDLLGYVSVPAKDFFSHIYIPQLVFSQCQAYRCHSALNTYPNISPS